MDNAHDWYELKLDVDEDALFSSFKKGHISIETIYEMLGLGPVYHCRTCSAQVPEGTVYDFTCDEEIVRRIMES